MTKNDQCLESIFRPFSSLYTWSCSYSLTLVTSNAWLHQVMAAMINPPPILFGAKIAQKSITESTVSWTTGTCLQSSDVGTQVVSTRDEEGLHFWGVIYCCSSPLLNSGSLRWVNARESAGSPKADGKSEEDGSKKLQLEDCWHLLSSLSRMPSEKSSI